MSESVFIGVEEVADRLDLSRSRIYEMVKGNEIPHQRFGRYVKFRWESIERWLDDREEVPT